MNNRDTYKVNRNSARGQAPVPIVDRVRRVLADSNGVYRRTTVVQLPDGDAGTYAVLKIMRDVARAAALTNPVRAVASAIVSRYGQRDNIGPMVGLYEWLEEHVRFKPDTLGTEVLHFPAQLLHEIAVVGRTAVDCDDVATLAAAIGRAMGYVPHFVICKKTEDGPWVHVHYALSRNGIGPIPFDPQERVRAGSWSCPANMREIHPA